MLPKNSINSQVVYIIIRKPSLPGVVIPDFLRLSNPAPGRADPKLAAVPQQGMYRLVGEFGDLLDTTLGRDFEHQRAWTAEGRAARAHRGLPLDDHSHLAFAAPLALLLVAAGGRRRAGGEVGEASLRREYRGEGLTRGRRGKSRHLGVGRVVEGLGLAVGAEADDQALAGGAEEDPAARQHGDRPHVAVAALVEDLGLAAGVDAVEAAGKAGITICVENSYEPSAEFFNEIFEEFSDELNSIGRPKNG